MRTNLLDVPRDAMRLVLGYLSGQNRHALRATSTSLYTLASTSGSALCVPIGSFRAADLCRARIAAPCERLPFWGTRTQRVVLVIVGDRVQKKVARGFCEALADLRGALPPETIELRATDTYFARDTVLELANWVASAESPWQDAGIELTGPAGACGRGKLWIPDMSQRLVQRLAWCDYRMNASFHYRMGDAPIPTFPLLRNLIIWDLQLDRHAAEVFPAVRCVQANIDRNGPIRCIVQALSAGLETLELDPGAGLSELIALPPNTLVKITGELGDRAVVGGRIVYGFMACEAWDDRCNCGLHTADSVCVIARDQELGTGPVQDLPNCLELTLQASKAFDDSWARTRRRKKAENRPARPAETRLAQALRLAPRLRRLRIDPCTVEVSRLGNDFPDSLLLVDMTRDPYTQDRYELPEDVAASHISHLIAALSARRSDGMPRRIVAPECKEYPGGRAVGQTIAELRAAKHGDAPDVWLPVSCPWEFRGPGDAGPPAGARVTSVLITQQWFRAPWGPTARSTGADWAKDVETLVLRPPLGEAIQKAALQIAGFFGNATRMHLDDMPKEQADVLAVRAMMCAMGPRLRVLVRPGENGTDVTLTPGVGAACPWLERP